jgi:hypothetical protein
MYRTAVQSEKLEKTNSNIPDIFFYPRAWRGWQHTNMTFDNALRLGFKCRLVATTTV